jgi:hypothetical protein
VPWFDARNVYRDPVAGESYGVRYYWQETLNAGDVRTLIDLDLTPDGDHVVYLELDDSATEVVDVVITQHNPRGIFQQLVQLGPGGSHRTRCPGRIVIEATLSNLQAGSGRVKAWVYTEGDIDQAQPPLQASLVNLADNGAGGPGGFADLSPIASGFCPPLRARVTMTATNQCRFVWRDVTNVVFGVMDFSPTVTNRELSLWHPPQCKLSVRNSGATAFINVVATWI